MPLNTQLIQFNPPLLPSGYCFTTLQRYGIDLFANASAVFRSDIGNSFFNQGSDVPSADNRIFPWLNTNDGLWYFWNGGIGKWTAAMPASTRELTFRMTWAPAAGTASSAVWSLDGGSGENPAVRPPDAYNGATWDIDTDFAGRFLLAAGLIPGTSDTANVSTNGGEATHALTKEEMPPHTHDFKIVAKAATDNGGGAITSGDPNTVDNSIPDFTTLNAGGNTATPPVVVAHNNVPQYRAIYVIKPTVRKWYTVAG